MLTAETLGDANVRPNYINTFKATDGETGEKVDAYGIVFTDQKAGDPTKPYMASGDSVTLEINSDPELWQESEGNFGKSVKAFFTLEDGTLVSSYIRSGETALRSGAGPGVSLIQTLREHKAGDIVTITKETRQNPKDATRSYNLFHVEKVDGFQ